MDIVAFSTYIRSTPLLNDAEKDYYCTHAEGFSQAYRDEIIRIIREEEDNFLMAVKEKDAKKSEEIRLLTQVQLANMREKEAKERGQECVVAEKNL